MISLFFYQNRINCNFSSVRWGDSKFLKVVWYLPRNSVGNRLLNQDYIGNKISVMFSSVNADL